jgi:hypothetical protein
MINREGRKGHGGRRKKEGEEEGPQMNADFHKGGRRSGRWRLGNDYWRLDNDLWNSNNDFWNSNNDLWNSENDRWNSENDRWKSENGRWKSENGRWKSENSRWKSENSRCRSNTCCLTGFVRVVREVRGENENCWSFLWLYRVCGYIAFAVISRDVLILEVYDENESNRVSAYSDGGIICVCPNAVRRDAFGIRIAAAGG